MNFYSNLFLIITRYSLHIGHSVLSTSLLNSWILQYLKNKIWIINVFKTILFLKIVNKFLRFIVNFNFPIWFINMEFTKELIFKKFAYTCGEFYCTRVWVRGFLSNFRSVQNSINKYILKRHVIKSVDNAYLAKQWITTRFTWPRGIFLSNIIYNYIVCKEANSINLPIIAIMDTNIKSHLFNFPIPANDDSINSVCFILSYISRQILLYKYKKLITWYIRYFSRKRKIFKVMNKLYKWSEYLNVSKIFIKRKKSIYL